MIVRTLNKYFRFPGDGDTPKPPLRGWGITSKKAMWKIDLNYITQTNSYVQLLATLCLFYPLLRDLRQTSTERFVKPAVVQDFCKREVVIVIGTHY